MQSLGDLVFNAPPGFRFAAMAMDVWLKSFVVLMLAGATCLLWRRAPAATRHLIWFLALSVLPALPLLSSMLPSWQKPLWSLSTRVDPGNQVSFALDFGPLATTGANPLPGQISASMDSDRKVVPRASTGRQIAGQFNRSWLPIVFAMWIVGFLWNLFTAVLGCLRLKQIRRGARAVNDSEWEQLLRAACKDLRLRQKVILLQSTGKAMPLTWGWWHPKVLLPSDVEQWPAERRRLVLLHELAHIKRRDYLSQWIARLICALFWCNPLTWVAARSMCIERERACDDLVLSGGCKASDYADQLVDIARTFRHIPQISGIAMARSSGLEKRVTAIIDSSRPRHLRPMVLGFVVFSVALMALGIGGCKTAVVNGSAKESQQLRERQLARLEAFSVAKEKQSQTLAAAAGEDISPLFQRFFTAAKAGDWQSVTNMYADFKKHHPQYSREQITSDLSLRTAYWQPVLEICLAYDHVVNCDPRYTQMAVDGIVGSIPVGSIYFGGTDPGRGLPTAFCSSHTASDPFYSLTQNALANGTYLEYLQKTYGDKSQLLEAFIKARGSDVELRELDSQAKAARQNLAVSSGDPDNPDFKAADEALSEVRQRIDDRTAGIWAALEAKPGGRESGSSAKVIYTPMMADSQKCFMEYLEGARQRLQAHQLKPGEHVEESGGRVQVSGQTAVMSINALMVKIIFDKNAGHEFYIEESFPLEWMYPYLEPHGLILKINRQPLAELPDNVVRQDRAYWSERVNRMIGDWLTDETRLKELAAFVEKTYLRKDLGGFKGDPRFVQNDYASMSFSHWRASIAGMYAWRAEHAAGDSERGRMAGEADFAFSQAWALCPTSLDVVNRYVVFLKSQGRLADASLVEVTAAKFPVSKPGGETLKKPANGAKSIQFELRWIVDEPAVDAERMVLVFQGTNSAKPYSEPLYVQKEVMLDATAVQSARVSRDSLGRVDIEFTLTDAGRKRFAEVTRQNIGKRLAIVIDGRVQSAPWIRAEITGGKGVIEGIFSDREAQELASRLNNAAK